MSNQNSILRCPHCQNDDKSMIEENEDVTYVNLTYTIYYCKSCSKEFTAVKEIKDGRINQIKS